MKENERYGKKRDLWKLLGMVKPKGSVEHLLCMKGIDVLLLIKFDGF